MDALRLNAATAHYIIYGNGAIIQYTTEISDCMVEYRFYFHTAYSFRPFLRIYYY